MSGPQPPYGSEQMRSIVQHGGPIGVVSGSQTGAVTFSTAWPDTNYMMDLEFVSGPPPSQGNITFTKNVNYSIQQFYGTIDGTAFNWQAWRLV